MPEESKPIDWVEMVRKQILMDLASENVSIALFGSYARGIGKVNSDVDVAVISKGEWNRSKLTLLREKLEESNIPYKVDIVDFSLVSPEFRKIALQKVVWWRQ